MKVVPDAASAQAALESAQREAQAYFGRPECYMERYLTKPRHVELQIFCDTQGNGICIGDRDCSTQRRHQKLVEEAPAPAIPDATRVRMYEDGVKVALACGYVGAGTIEMLYQDGDFYFLEMNTRLQVEHCVTEEVTGLDLVAWQLAIAAGGPIPLTADKIEPRGHAIEARINAENAAKGFLPSPGPIRTLRVPSGPGVRWDGGYEAGDEISQYYDNLVGKLIVWAPTREAAIARMLRALGEFEISGIHTTIPAHRVLIAHPDFAAVEHSTKWVEEAFDVSAFAEDAAAPADAGGAEREPLVERSMPVEVNGKRFAVKVWVPEGAFAAAQASSAGAGGNGTRKRATAARASSASGGGSGTVAAPMQGTIVKVLVAQGDTVELGQTLVVLEAMKMENNIVAGTNGTVAELRVEPGQSVGTGDVLAVIE
jgi:acetyl-CoA/propionyl-CoA carboxylase biotin carboxyl carrier protein